MQEKESISQLKDRALKFVLDAFEIYKNREALEDNWQKWDKIFSLLPERENRPFIANLNPPSTRSAVKALINFCDEALWSNTPMFRLKGVGGASDNERAKINETLLQLQMEKMGFRQSLREFITNQVIYGFAIAKVGYALKEKYVVKEHHKSLIEILKSVLSNAEIEKTKVPVYDNLTFIPLSPFNVYWDYFGDWDKQECIIEQISDVSESQLKLIKESDPDNYFDINAILQELGDSTMESERPKSEIMDHTQQITGLSGSFKIKKKRHELLEAWCNFDIDNDGIDEECVITVLDRKHIIRLQLNPYDIGEKPYVFCKWEKVAQADSLGIGVCQLASRSQEALNSFTNQLMDDITMILDCMVVVDEMANISTDQLKSRPHGVIRSSAGVDAVQFYRPPDVSVSAMKAISMVKDDIREASGATVSMQGLPARYDTTATEARQMGNSAQRDIYTKLRTIEDCVIKQFLRRAYSYNLQFMSTLDIEKIIGVDAFAAYLQTTGKSVADKDYDLKSVLMADYDFIPLGITQIENKVVKGQQAMNLYNIALQSPQGIWNVRELAKLIVKYVADGDISVLAEEVENKLISPQDENILMSQGEKPQAKTIENHREHILIHEAARLPEIYEGLRQEHLNQHLKMLQQIQQQQIMQMQAQQMQAQQMAMAQQAQQKQQGVPSQEQPIFAPKGITAEQAGQVPNMVNAPVGIGGAGGI